LSFSASEPVLRVIGARGLYDINGPQKVREETIRSSFSKPPDDLIFMKLRGQGIVFLARHGHSHGNSPRDVIRPFVQKSLLRLKRAVQELSET
jgi:purine nucleoside phosphorylase